jgi:hypothetical protein
LSEHIEQLVSLNLQNRPGFRHNEPELSNLSSGIDSRPRFVHTDGVTRFSLGDRFWSVLCRQREATRYDDAQSEWPGLVGEDGALFKGDLPGDRCEIEHLGTRHL